LEGLVLFFHIIVCLLLVVIVLLQSGKSADLAGAFGGMGSQSTFGPRGTASFLSRMTTTLAILFMVTSLTLWMLAAKKGSTNSVLTQDDVSQVETTAPATVDESKDKAVTDTPTTDAAATDDKTTETPAADKPAVDKTDKTVDKTAETPKTDDPPKQN